jgi:regulator of replication initiation timing
MKKSILVFVIIVSFSFISNAAIDANDANDYQGKIKQLERTIESLQKRLDKLTAAYNEIKKENEQLKALLPKEKITINTKSTANFDPNNGIVYNGKKRDVRWFNYMFKEFQNKILFVDGKYIYIDENKTVYGEKKVKRGQGLGGQGGIIEVNEDSNFLFRPVPEGTLIKLRNMGTVLQVLGRGEALISRNGDIYHIKGYKDSLVDRQDIYSSLLPLSSILDYEGYFYLIKPVGTGTFEYVDTRGAKRTIQSFIVCEPLTKDQFADALNSGFILKRQSKTGGKITETEIR